MEQDLQLYLEMEGDKGQSERKHAPRQPSRSPPKRPPATPFSSGRRIEMEGHKKDRNLQRRHSYSPRRRERRDSRDRRDRRDRRVSRSRHRERRQELRGVWEETPQYEAQAASSSSRVVRILSQTIADLAQVSHHH